jgi:hypothetical protein
VRHVDGHQGGSQHADGLRDLVVGELRRGEEEELHLAPGGGVERLATFPSAFG